MAQLETRRLSLRPMVTTDLNGLLEIFSDPEVMACFGVPPFGLAEMERWLQRNLDHQQSNGYGLFSVILKSSGLLIGDCGLERMEIDGVPTVELGYDFRSDHWNNGYATEAASAVRDFAFVQLKLPQLVSLIQIGNGASRRVAEKIGMSYAGRVTRDGRHYWKYAIERRL